MMIEFWDFEFAECQYGNLKLSAKGRSYYEGV